MGERIPFQPLTPWDRVSVILYRTGIVLSTGGLVAGAVLLWQSQAQIQGYPVRIALGAFILGNLLSAAFIHLYAEAFRRAVRTLGLLAAAVLAGLAWAAPSLAEALLLHWYGAMTLGLFAAVLAFVAVKEAFCFRLNEGYLIALFLALAVLIHLMGASVQQMRVVVSATAALLLLFTVRKVTQPLHYDIGNKTQYQ